MEADVLAGGREQLGNFPDFKGKKIYVSKDLNMVIKEVESQMKKGLEVAVLATGDPLLFGIGNTLIEYFGAESIKIIPSVSSPQAAFSVLGIPSYNAVVLSRHGKKSDDLNRLRYFPRGVILTGGENGPSEVINEIIKIIPTAEEWQGAVCQFLGSKNEKIDKGNLKNLTGRRYLSKNLVVIQNPCPEELTNSVKPLANKSNNSKLPSADINFGRADESFLHSESLITHSEVRAVLLSKLELGGAKTLWDVGAGSGAVGIEAALLSPQLRVYSIEKNEARFGDILGNIHSKGKGNIDTVFCNAVDISLPDPDRVFIGGGGRDLGKILINCYEKLKKGGVLVVNTVTIDSFDRVLSFAKQRNIEVEAVTINVSRMSNISGYRFMKPQNPITVFRVRK